MQPSIPWSSSVSVFVIERMAIIHSLKCAVPFSIVLPLLSIALTHCHLLSRVVTRCIIRCYSLSLFVPLVVTRCHSLPFAVTRTTFCHSLSFAVTRCTTRCHSLSLVVSRCTTRLSFYKRSLLRQETCIQFSIKYCLSQVFERSDVKETSVAHFLKKIIWKCSSTYYTEYSQPRSQSIFSLWEEGEKLLWGRGWSTAWI